MVDKKHLKIYVSDAVAFLHYLLDDLPQESEDAFQSAENGDAIVYLPTIVAAELFYLFRKKRRMGMWSKFKNAMNDENNNFKYFPFDKDVLGAFERTKAKEIHDKIIISTAKVAKSDFLITKDGDLVDIQEVKTLW